MRLASLGLSTSISNGLFINDFSLRVSGIIECLKCGLCPLSLPVNLIEIDKSYGRLRFSLIARIISANCRGIW